MRRAGLCLVMLLMATCARPQPAPVQQVTVVADDVPRYFSLPAVFHDHDYVCLDADQPGTCATVGEVKLFLISKRAEATHPLGPLAPSRE